MALAAPSVALAALEARIEHGLATFVQVGEALLEIRDRRLYREAGFAEFDAYCRARWGWQRARSYRLMDGAKVVRVLSPIGDTPTNEAQARELVPVLRDEGPEAVAEVWEQAQEAAPNGKVTAEVVRDVVRERSGMAVHYSSEEDDWRTPSHVVEKVVEALGAIDLDPCSNEGEPNVPALVHYDRASDGLSKDWRGRVYMNPPYGRVIEQWVDKLASAYQAGRVQEAIALLPSRTDTSWFRRLREFPRCFISGRLHFGSAEAGAPFPSVAVYLGPTPETFYAAFADLGDSYELVTA